MAAVKKEDVPLIQLLVVTGTDANQLDGENYVTALITAILKQANLVVKMLQDAGANPDVEVGLCSLHPLQLRLTSPPPMAAVEMGDLAVISTLLEFVADVDAEGDVILLW
ncbi:uncharacterized protein Z518_09785 [Rhinocladiella mackenziei CBS 650.93]|uniref:Uncharacterized protein n=1 Tax=Rhinocladiella mackenziei CBS 650.93 TaxID=1442369 RepID=A0A0D2IVI9_9EURO|nr:uncharacterized protein Z518_09785 [Rhinocladiella mackenziei CBS 650.93]KIX00720.1 hypothetical protein Z518_09785 [Rhinocladiella mackenziei CBS 650.93]